MDLVIRDQNGAALDARVEWDGNDLILHSRSGLDRNPQYRPALELIMVRLDSASIAYDIYLDSRPVQNIPIAERQLRVSRTGSVADRFHLLVRAMNAGSASQGAYRRLRIVPSAPTNAVTAVLSATGGTPAKERLPAEQLRRVTAAQIDRAVARLLSGEDALNFAPSRDYDVLAPGNVRLAPKKVFGLALEEALGIQVFPEHFTAGRGNPCFELIEAAGYPILEKAEPNPKTDALIDPEMVSAEGSPRLVRHLKRERNPALVAAKRRAMVAALGHLTCERCSIVPSISLGPHGDAVIEVHHAKVQIGEMAEGHLTRLSDLECLCANCHKIVHREMKAADYGRSDFIEVLDGGK